MAHTEGPGPDSLAWKMHKELTVFVGGLRAVLMQAAHPLVAAALDPHGRPPDPRSMLLEVQALPLLAAFGSTDEIRRAAEHATRNCSGVDPATGEGFDLRDPELQAWMHACLEQSTVVFYELTVRPLTAWQKDRYHRENLTVARLRRLTSDSTPPDYAGIEDAVGRMIASGRLMATGASRLIVDALSGSKVPFRLRPLWLLARFAAIGTLPPPIRELHGLRWSPARSRFLLALLWLVKRLRPFVPHRRRWIAPALVAERRLQGEAVEMPAGLLP